MAPKAPLDAPPLGGVNIKCGIVAGLVAMADRLDVPSNDWFIGTRLDREQLPGVLATMPLGGAR